MYRFSFAGQFGSPLFSYSALIGFLIATFVSILDSIGDYYAAAKMCQVPPPPRHAINRGIAIEGFCSMLSGFYGTGHATTTYGGNIGTIGMTKVLKHGFLFKQNSPRCDAALRRPLWLFCLLTGISSKMKIKNYSRCP